LVFSNTWKGGKGAALREEKLRGGEKDHNCKGVKGPWKRLRIGKGKSPQEYVVGTNTGDYSNGERKETKKKISTTKQTEG